MITGALSLKQKTVDDVMTRLEDVFMLNINAILDFETVSMIQSKGYSRIPVYEEDRKNVSMVKLFHAKDLAFVDPTDAMPIRTLLQFYNHEPVIVDANTPLNQVLRYFKEGKSHLALVRQCFGGDTDPVWEMVGIVTLEDVIEEILQAEIVDETDTLSDNRMKRRRKEVKPKDFSDFAKIGGGKEAAAISPQMALAAYQFLSCAIPAFQSPQLSPETLRKLMSQKIYFLERVNHEEEEGAPERFVKLYDEGQKCDYFILIIEGRVKVTVGRERLVFMSGPFSYFGVEALSMDCSEFTPDYSVEVLETTTYIKITRSVYMFAYQAHKMQQANSELTVKQLEEMREGSSIDSGIKSPLSVTSEESDGVSVSVTPSKDPVSQHHASLDHDFRVDLGEKGNGHVSVAIDKNSSSAESHDAA